jgi:hypothetical protein
MFVVPVFAEDPHSTGYHVIPPGIDVHVVVGDDADVSINTGKNSDVKINGGNLVNAQMLKDKLSNTMTFEERRAIQEENDRILREKVDLFVSDLSSGLTVTQSKLDATMQAVASLIQNKQLTDSDIKKLGQILDVIKTCTLSLQDEVVYMDGGLSEMSLNIEVLMSMIDDLEAKNKALESTNIESERQLASRMESQFDIVNTQLANKDIQINELSKKLDNTKQGFFIVIVIFGLTIIALSIIMVTNKKNK